jgi:hypothetical protein
VVEVLESCFLADFFFELMNRAGGFDGLDAAAVGANQVVAVGPGDEKGEVGSALVKAEAAHDSFVVETLKEPEHGGLVALLGEMTAAAQVSEGHRAIVIGEAGENSFQGLGASKAGGAGALEKVFVEFWHLK